MGESVMQKPSAVTSVVGVANLPADAAGQFTVMVKPAGPQCNQACHYCYYTEKHELFPRGESLRMTDETLAAFIRDYVASQPGPNVTFLWQGGEPTLLGLDFFERIVALQQECRAAGKVIRNALQTNGTLLDRRWARFLREQSFLVGLSIDGTRRDHDSYRVTKKGVPTFETVLGALRLLRNEGVAFNTLTVVHRQNAVRGREIYRFLRAEGVQFMQFIPLVERCGPDGRLSGPPQEDAAGRATPWSVHPGGFGTFVCDVFDEWVRRDVGTISVQQFDVHLAQWAGLPSNLCVFAETCGRCLVMEHNGDLYACDHYVYPAYRLGNLRDRPLRDLAGDPAQQRFGSGKRDGLPHECRHCRFLFACNGGCPKHRFARASNGEVGLNYLCPSYKRYLAHIGPELQRMTTVHRPAQPTHRKGEAAPS